jgi:hypothetical protein
MSHSTRIAIQLTAVAVMFAWAWLINTQDFPRPVRLAVPLACSAWFLYFALTIKRENRQRRGFPVIPKAPDRPTERPVS